MRALLGEGAAFAARQAAALFALAAGLTAATAVLPSTRSAPLFVIGATALAVAMTAWLLPWDRFDARWPLVLTLPALCLLAATIWAYRGVASSTAPFFMLLFVWVGLHFSARAVLVLALPAAVAYLTPLIAAGRGVLALIGGALFIPAMVVIGLLIARQVDYHRRDRTVIQRAHDEARRAERWRAALTATLAHDVRSPLTTVQFALETLDDDIDALPPAQRREMVKMALRQTGRIRRLAVSLLDADRIDTEGRLRLDVQAVSVRDAIEDALTYITAPVSVDMAGEAEVLADPQRLEQILINLLVNAVRHGEPPIVVSAGPVADDMIAISVRDHGPGVPADRREALFSRFSSADTAPESIGLGLWITRELARAQGGDVVHTPADPGACFTVTLPARPQRPAGSRPPPARS
ncbi:sensor histidine kinase [Planomonospora parontospora]|uniref:sensor histidine kinase n=1 Tax=Planomonospora parontospora TaxID=58119 RepID=UPI00167061B9|nr:HAMP domain-containing sensor histidine kinase [Planomonospora parontospora]GGL58734.1 hypothetical protein GCM10014719_70150 [Planomonospora parontospora subsp. antibiotica]GII20173.1 hypothetical protein Ppa05_68990 [Planomonospora parontospora subsp. antibiotica]